MYRYNFNTIQIIYAIVHIYPGFCYKDYFKIYVGQTIRSLANRLFASKGHIPTARQIYQQAIRNPLPTRSTDHYKSQLIAQNIAEHGLHCFIFIPLQHIPGCFRNTFDRQITWRAIVAPLEARWAQKLRSFFHQQGYNAPMRFGASQNDGFNQYLHRNTPAPPRSNNIPHAPQIQPSNTTNSTRIMLYVSRGCRNWLTRSLSVIRAQQEHRLTAEYFAKFNIRSISRILHFLRAHNHRLLKCTSSTHALTRRFLGKAIDSRIKRIKERSCAPRLLCPA